MNWYKAASLSEWFGKGKKGDWVNICRKNKDGSFPPCGRSDADTGAYPKCRPRASARSMSESKRQSACSRKRKVENKSSTGGKARKPNFVSTYAKGKKK